MVLFLEAAASSSFCTTSSWYKNCSLKKKNLGNKYFLYLFPETSFPTPSRMRLTRSDVEMPGV